MEIVRLKMARYQTHGVSIPYSARVIIQFGLHSLQFLGPKCLCNVKKECIESIAIGCIINYSHSISGRGTGVL